MATSTAFFSRPPLILAQLHGASQVTWRRWSSTRSYSGRTKPLRVLTTLNPSKLTNQDFIDVSAMLQPRVWSHTGVKGVIGRSYKDPYPEGTKGFLYYHVPPPHLPPIMGELRFRITENSDPSTFDRGSDLLDPKTTMPWNIPLLLLMKKKTNRMLLDLLLTDGLVSEELVQHCDMLWQTYPASVPSQRNITLYYLEQPFFIPFHLSQFFVRVVLKERLVISNIRVGGGLFRDLRSTKAEFEGSGIVRFERSGTGGNHLAIRVLKIVERIERKPGTESFRICEPVEGELLRRITSRPPDIHTLLIDLDTPRTRGLKELGLYQAIKGL
ncbi:hypothetical protein APHAL10511_005479 [Amanita phalloides]|nr:hypothetical protein APHAL10511_005479 [Amanita phalloides]